MKLRNAFTSGYCAFKTTETLVRSCRSVVSVLENGSVSLPPPKQPVYFAERNAAEGVVSYAETITVLEGW
jgi:hypothetical protein